MVSWKYCEMFQNSCYYLGTDENERFIENKKITSERSVRLLGIEIDNQLNFGNHVSTLCKKADSQLNAIGRLKKYIGFPEKKALVEAFVFSNFK